MSTVDELLPLIENLEKEMSELETSIKPLTEKGVADYLNDMAPIDKAKAYILSLYALNSTIFSTLKIGELDLSHHPVMNDIRRVQTYMAKIKNAEELAGGRQLQLDRQAAGRFIKHALSGNEDPAENRARKVAKRSELVETQILTPEAETGSTESDNVKQPGRLVDETVTKFLSEMKNDANENTSNFNSEKKRKNKKKNKNKNQNGNSED
ncbi:hypothetical protein V1517DRAFT_313551 [Lipomyces orientalis]|uniref:Uncharacterized protein n=1 Tax=Lipomyces orientalis TaxID=1233043 RepID=A0ACC3TX12_9ASCO